MAKVAIVGDDEDRRGGDRTVGAADLVHERQQDRIRRPSAAVSDAQPGRDALPAETAVRRTIEDDIDVDRRRDDASKPSDQRGPRGAGRGARQAVDQVRAVDEEPGRGLERVGGEGSHRCHRTRAGAGEPAARYDRSVSLLLLVDLDGVVYRGSDPVPGVAAVLTDRAARGDDVVYVTNNSMHYRADYVTRLSAMGAPVTQDRVVSSARATALYVSTHAAGIRRVLVLGASGLERELRDAGLDVVTAAHAATRMHQEGVDGWTAAGAPDAVVTGLDPNLTYLRLAAATDCIRAGATFIATNRDPVYPTERGLRPGAGSVAAAVEAATGVTPLSIGKPEPHLLELAAEAVGRDPREAVMIGDGIDTDLAAARAVGARCILMLTGVATREQVHALPLEDWPTAIAADAEELAAVLGAMAG